MRRNFILLALMTVLVNAIPSYTFALGPNTVDSAAIIDGQVKTADIDLLAVTTDKIDNGAVTSNKIATGAVATTSIAAGAVTTGTIADGAVNDVKISGTISASKIQKPANVITVAQSGGDFTSIQAALDSISPSVENPFLIKIMPGTYTEIIIMKSYVHLQGAGYDITTIQSPTPSSDVITLNSLVGVTISDMSIIGGSCGIRNNGSSFPTISRNKITGNHYGIFHWEGSSRIYNNIISNNAIGIFSVVGGSIIAQNTITGNNEWGIWEQSGGSTTIKGNIISGNGNGISVVSGAANISENTITGNVSNGIDLYVASATTIYRNTISENGGFGIHAIGSILIVSFNVYDTIQVIGSYGMDSGPVDIVGMYNVKPDGSPVSLP